MDILFLGIGAAFAVATLLLARLCDTLSPRREGEHP